MRMALSQTDKDSTPKPANVEKDSYAEQILKYIPAEVVAFYLPAIATAAALPNGAEEKVLADGSTVMGPATADSPYGYAILGIFLVSVIASFAYFYRSSKKNLVEKKVLDPTLRAIIKAGISAVAFIIWALYLGGIFQFITNDHETFGTLGILFFTLIAPPLYDVLVSRFTLPPSIIMEYEHDYTTKPAGTNSFFATNLSPNDDKITALELYWKSWKTLWRYAPESVAPVSKPIKTGDREAIDQILYFRKRKVDHILKIRTESGYVVTSEPFKDKQT